MDCLTTEIKKIHQRAQEKYIQKTEHLKAQISDSTATNATQNNSACQPDVPGTIRWPITTKFLLSQLFDKHQRRTNLLTVYSKYNKSQPKERQEKKQNHIPNTVFNYLLLQILQHNHVLLSLLLPWLLSAKATV